MKISKIQRGLVVLTTAVGMLAVGCELIVDFDRTKIPAEVSEASVPDVNTPETTTPVEAGADVVTPTDADADAGETPDADDDAGDAADQ